MYYQNGKGKAYVDEINNGEGEEKRGGKKRKEGEYRKGKRNIRGKKTEG